MLARATISRLLITVLVLLAACVDRSGGISVRASGVLAASPTSIGETLAPGQQVTRPLVITNTGTTPITALLYEAYAQPLLAMAHVEVLPAYRYHSRNNRLTRAW
jgi:hypothetical protein